MIEESFQKGNSIHCLIIIALDIILICRQHLKITTAIKRNTITLRNLIIYSKVLNIILNPRTSEDSQ